MRMATATEMPKGKEMKVKPATLSMIVCASRAVCPSFPAKIVCWGVRLEVVTLDTKRREEEAERERGGEKGNTEKESH